MATPASAPPQALASVDDACVHYGDVVALAPTTLSIAGGAAVALVGSNGSGKTTLPSLLAGLTVPTDGAVTVEGRVSMVTQHHDHHRWMPLSVDEVLRMGRYQVRGLLGRLGDTDRAAIDRSAELTADPR